MRSRLGLSVCRVYPDDPFLVGTFSTFSVFGTSSTIDYMQASLNTLAGCTQYDCSIFGRTRRRGQDLDASPLSSVSVIPKGRVGLGSSLAKP